MSNSLKIYIGSRRPQRTCVVTVADGLHAAPYVLPLRLDLCNHSPTGFDWGYGGSGPAQLALAILADYLGAERARDLHQEFKTDVIAQITQSEWRMTGDDINAWYRNRVASAR
jgi:Family of unknown function (DUF6166)